MTGEGPNSSAESSVDLLLRKYRAPTAKCAIRAAAGQELIRARAHGFSGPPFDPEMLASLMGIDVKPAPPGLEDDAMLVPGLDGRLTIVVNRDRPRSRQRFSIAHELGHALFPDCAERVRFRSSAVPLAREAKEVEELCHLAAAEFLMPNEEFQADLDVLGLGMDAVPDLASTYDVSPEAAAHRLLRFISTPVALVVLRHQHKIREDPRKAPKKLRLQYSAYNEAFAARLGDLHLPSLKSAPDHSCAYEAFHRADVGAVTYGAQEDWEIRTLPVAVRVEATALPAALDEHVRVMAFLHFTD